MKKEFYNVLTSGDHTPVILKSNVDLGIDVRILENEDGSICINAEDAAIGFGWTQVKNGKTYVRWETINNNCMSLGFSQQVGKDDYIPESLFYLLGMKAENKVAQEFQRWLAVDVIPDIRKTGSYVKHASQLEGISPELQAIILHDKKIQVVEKRMSDIEDNIHIDHLQKKQLRQFVSTVAVNACGTKYSKAYKEFGKKVYSAIYHDLYNRFGVSCYEEIPKVKFQDALKFINDWGPNRELQLLIIGSNMEGGDCNDI